MTIIALHHNSHCVKSKVAVLVPQYFFGGGSCVPSEKHLCSKQSPLISHNDLKKMVISYYYLTDFFTWLYHTWKKDLLIEYDPYYSCIRWQWERKLFLTTERQFLFCFCFLVLFVGVFVCLLVCLFVFTSLSHYLRIVWTVATAG